jgi:membrane protease YdiL (CAAX protease family)
MHGSASIIDLKNPFIKCVLPLAAIAIILLLSKYKYKISYKEDLGLTQPPLSSVLWWMLTAIGWMLVTDYFMNWRETFDFTIWKQQPLHVSALRIAAVCFLGPVAEELIFRGLLQYRLTRFLKGRQVLSAVILAAVWAAIHMDYSIAVIAVIFVEGLILGASRINTRSVITPIILHICWNLYAIW